MSAILPSQISRNLSIFRDFLLYFLLLIDKTAAKDSWLVERNLIVRFGFVHEGWIV